MGYTTAFRSSDEIEAELVRALGAPQVRVFREDELAAVGAPVTPDAWIPGTLVAEAARVQPVFDPDDEVALNTKRQAMEVGDRAVAGLGVTIGLRIESQMDRDGGEKEQVIVERVRRGLVGLALRDGDTVNERDLERRWRESGADPGERWWTWVHGGNHRRVTIHIAWSKDGWGEGVASVGTEAAFLDDVPVSRVAREKRRALKKYCEAFGVPGILALGLHVYDLPRLMEQAAGEVWREASDFRESPIVGILVIPLVRDRRTPAAFVRISRTPPDLSTWFARQGVPVFELQDGPHLFELAAAPMANGGVGFDDPPGMRAG